MDRRLQYMRHLTSLTALVNPGELGEVQVEWHDLEWVLQRHGSGRWISAAVGVGMVAAMLLLPGMTS